MIARLIKEEKMGAVGRLPALCVTGANAAPPDDVGGAYGYAEFVDAITDPRHPEHQAMLDWFGSTFDPTAFDIAEVDRQLAKIKL